uniref:Uncharacterized protein n=1 Tax=Glossina pallidipes TaxID=7398 RepID=A0A1B0A9D4_GLOPL
MAAHALNTAANYVCTVLSSVYFAGCLDIEKLNQMESGPKIVIGHIKFQQSIVCVIATQKCCELSCIFERLLGSGSVSMSSMDAFSWSSKMFNLSLFVVYNDAFSELFFFLFILLVAIN